MAPTSSSWTSTAAARTAPAGARTGSASTSSMARQGCPSSSRRPPMVATPTTAGASTCTGPSRPATRCSAGRCASPGRATSSAPDRSSTARPTSSSGSSTSWTCPTPGCEPRSQAPERHDPHRRAAGPRRRHGRPAARLPARHGAPLRGHRARPRGALRGRLDDQPGSSPSRRREDEVRRAIGDVLERFGPDPVEEDPETGVTTVVAPSDGGPRDAHRTRTRAWSRRRRRTWPSTARWASARGILAARHRCLAGRAPRLAHQLLRAAHARVGLLARPPHLEPVSSRSWASRPTAARARPCTGSRRPSPGPSGRRP